MAMVVDIMAVVEMVEGVVIKNMKWCKKLQYQILYNKKLDWLKKKSWKPDKIDGVVWGIVIFFAVLVAVFGRVFVLPTMVLFYMAFLLVLVRRMKSMSESLLSICVQMVFITISLIFVIMIGIIKLL